MAASARTVVIGVVALGLALAPIAIGGFTVTLLNYIGIYTLVALGLVLLTGCGGITSFGQAAFVGIGAYATAYLTTRWAVSPWLGFLASIALTSLIALILGYVTLHLGGHYLPLTTIAWGIAIFAALGSFEFLGSHGGNRRHSARMARGCGARRNGPALLSDLGTMRIVVAGRVQPAGVPARTRDPARYAAAATCRQASASTFSGSGCPCSCWRRRSPASPAGSMRT